MLNTVEQDIFTTGKGSDCILGLEDLPSFAESWRALKFPVLQYAPKSKIMNVRKETLKIVVDLEDS